MSAISTAAGPVKSSISEGSSVGETDGGTYDFPIPGTVLADIISRLSVERVLTCRQVCREWNNVVLSADLLDKMSCFVFDGRKEDSADQPKCGDYMDTSETRNYPWSHLKLRRVVARHCSWLSHHIETDPDFTSCVTTLDLLNSTLNWAQILQFLLDFENLTTFIDKQDIYCWDYATFNSGIEEDERIEDTQAYQSIRNLDRIETSDKLKVVKIHRSQLMECTTYLKILQLRCHSLNELEINTDQNFAPQRGNLFYSNLGRLLALRGESLRALRFPYKLVCPSYDFRITDEHRLFREFLNYITENEWTQRMNLSVLEELTIQFGIIPVEGQDIILKLAPFIQSLPSLNKLYIGCIHLESFVERILTDFLNLMPDRLHTQFGVFMNDAVGLPQFEELQNSLRSLSIQTFRDFAKELKEIVPTLGIETFPDLQEFQYFSKNHTFRSFNFSELIESFVNVTHLNLVDHNARLETRHSCEALATIENDDMQLIVKRMPTLVSLQVIGNHTFLTDEGLTGIKLSACQRMLKTGEFEFENEDIVGVPVSQLQGLRCLVLRGLGIKVTDVSARFGFCNMPFLTKLHLYGSHQITGEARVLMSRMYNVTRGCDLQV